MSWGQTKDLGAYIKPVYNVAETDVTAGGSGDATEVDGAWIDRQGFESMDVLLPFTATLASGETITFAANIQDADDSSGGGAADISTNYLSAVSATVAATGESGGSTETGVFQIGVDLTMAKRYVRVQFTPNMSASGTDTAKIQAVYILTGAKYPPANSSRVNIRA